MQPRNENNDFKSQEPYVHHLDGSHMMHYKWEKGKRQDICYMLMSFRIVIEPKHSANGLVDQELLYWI